MVPKGWDIVTDYYSNIDKKQWVPWSRPRVAPYADKRGTTMDGTFGGKDFSLSMNGGKSFWHDVPLWKDEGKGVVNMITEIPMGVTAKMEVNKGTEGNSITQDMNGDGSPRYYTYGTPFFNYGLIPQTWEDPEEYDGDNDPLDVIEIGGGTLKMGSSVGCKVLGSLELIDEGETDHKIICIAEGSEHYGDVNDMDELELRLPGTEGRLVHWLKYYKTSDGKGVNELANGEDALGVDKALGVIRETNGYWKRLCKEKDTDGMKEYGFDLSRCPETG